MISTARTIVIAIGLVGVVFIAGWAKEKRTGAAASGGQQGGRDEIRIELSGNGFAPSEAQHAPDVARFQLSAHSCFFVEIWLE
jgi:hypothetical protein